jgi:hypothetical protein
MPICHNALNESVLECLFVRRRVFVYAYLSECLFVRMPVSQNACQLKFLYVGWPVCQNTCQVGGRGGRGGLS